MATQNWDWVFHALGWTLAGLGLLLALWALFWDRSRGRRRCPKCWYSMEGAAEGDDGAVTCPECGRRIASDQALHKTRRRMKRAAFGVFVCALGYAAFVTPAVRQHGLVAATPTSALVLLVSTDKLKNVALMFIRLPSPDHRLEYELIRRSEEESIPDWQTSLLAWRFKRAHDNPPGEVEFKSYRIARLLSPRWWSSPIPFTNDDRATLSRKIKDLLTGNVSSESWIDYGGDDGELFRMGNRLFVWAPRRDQELVGLVLTLLTTKGQGNIARVRVPDWLGREDEPFNEIRMYDVTDLAPPNVTRYKQPPEPWTGPFDGSTDGELILFTGDSIRIIVDIVQSEIAFDDWIDNGGEKAMIFTVPGWLIVTALPEMHDQIESLLEKLRGSLPTDKGNP